MTDNTPCYVARKPCGCLCFAAVDNPDHKKDTAKEIARVIRAGYSIERMTVEEVRSASWWDRRGCIHTKEVRADG